MPLYEYRCADCDVVFEKLRPMSQADVPVACPHCGGMNTSRMLSLFAAVSKGEGGETHSIAGSSSCSSCTATSCSTCGLR